MHVNMRKLSSDAAGDDGERPARARIKRLVVDLTEAGHKKVSDAAWKRRQTISEFVRQVLKVQ
jgi:hypothetical protein